MSTLSYVKGPDFPILEKTIGQMVAEAAARSGNRQALIVRHQNVCMTWSEFDREIERTARGLAGLGLQFQDRVGIWSSNCAEWILLQMACARAGFVLVNVNPAYRSHELAFVLKKSRMRALFLWEKDARTDYRAILEEARAGQDLALEHVVGLETESWTRMLERGKPYSSERVLSIHPANIQYTSGTTGTPKGVVLSHRNLVNNAWITGEWLQITEEDRICNPCPLYHCSGSVVCGLTSLFRGATLILPAPQFHAGAVLEAIAAERATVLGGVPTMYIAELEHPNFPSFDLSSLRLAWMGGAPCPEELLRKVKQTMGSPNVVILYGLTESSPLITMTRPEEKFQFSNGNVGRAMPNTEIKIVSPATGLTLPIGEPGELCTRGYMLMSEYDDEPQATSRAIDDEGWLHTGDLAVLRTDGSFEITGRASEMIIRGGENISPREIEEFLYTNPKIAEVSVVGLPDRKLGEVVAAWIRLAANQSATEDEIRDFCHLRIAHFKIPEYIRFVDSFPSTVSGKVQRFRIREIEMEARGLNALSAHN